jgi:hypothetical protein
VELVELGADLIRPDATVDGVEELCRSNSQVAGARKPRSRGWAARESNPEPAD